MADVKVKDMIALLSDDELCEELINRGKAKRLPILIVRERENGDLASICSSRTSCFGLASWFLEDTRLSWQDEEL